MANRFNAAFAISGLILGLRPSKGRRRYFCNDIFHWLGASLEAALTMNQYIDTETKNGPNVVNDIFKNYSTERKLLYLIQIPLQCVCKDPITNAALV